MNLTPSAIPPNIANSKSPLINPYTAKKRSISFIIRYSRLIRTTGRRTKLIEDVPSRGHLELTSHILAAYRVLSPEVGIDKAVIQLIEHAMMEGVDPMSMRFALSSMLDSGRNPHDRPYNIFRWLMKQYGTTSKRTAPQA